MKRLLFFLLISFSIGAAAGPPENAWRYSCDVYLPGACTRMPAGAELTYSIPADFGLYELRDPAGSVLTIYAGSSPSPKPGGVPEVFLEGKGATLSAYSRREGDGSRLDLYIASRQAGAATIHAFGVINESNRDQFVQFVAGLRPCIRSKAEVVKCPANQAWGSRLAVFAASKAHEFEESSKPAAGD